jgi:hypothetical protein
MLNGAAREVFDGWRAPGYSRAAAALEVVVRSDVLGEGSA